MERNDKGSVKEALVEDAEAQNASDELEAVEMLRVGDDAGGGIDLQCVVVMCRIFEKIVKGVKYLMREQEKEFTMEVVRVIIYERLFRHKPRKPAIIQSILAFK